MHRKTRFGFSEPCFYGWSAKESNLQRHIVLKTVATKAVDFCNDSDLGVTPHMPTPIFIESDFIRLITSKNICIKDKIRATFSIKAPLQTPTHTARIITFDYFSIRITITQAKREFEAECFDMVFSFSYVEICFLI